MRKLPSQRVQPSDNDAYIRPVYAIPVLIHEALQLSTPCLLTCTACRSPQQDKISIISRMGVLGIEIFSSNIIMTCSLREPY